MLNIGTILVKIGAAQNLLESFKIFEGKWNIFGQVKVNLWVGNGSDSFFLHEKDSASRNLSITHYTLSAAHAHK